MNCGFITYIASGNELRETFSLLQAFHKICMFARIGTIPDAVQSKKTEN